MRYRVSLSMRFLVNFFIFWKNSKDLLKGWKCFHKSGCVRINMVLRCIFLWGHSKIYLLSPRLMQVLGLRGSSEVWYGTRLTCYPLSLMSKEEMFLLTFTSVAINENGDIFANIDSWLSLISKLLEGWSICEKFVGILIMLFCWRTECIHTNPTRCG